MVMKWKEIKEEGSSIVESSISAPFGKEELTKPFFKIMQSSPRKYVLRKERYCNFCNNCETSIRSIKNLRKELTKPYCQIILNCIKENKLKHFLTKDIINLTGASNLTNGTIQNKGLAVLTALGFLKKEIITYTNKKGETKMHYAFSINEEPIIPQCYDFTNFKHLNIWNNPEFVREEKYNE